MPGDRNRPTWKGATAGPAGRGPRYAWKPQDQAASAGLWTRRLTVAGLTLGGIACAALFVLLVRLLWHPPRAALVLVAADPVAAADRLDVSPDPYGYSGAQFLAQWASAAADQEAFRLRGKLTPSVFRDGPAPLGVAKDWAAALEGAPGDPLIIYVGLLGASDADGPDGPYLDPGDGHAPVRLKELLDLLAGGRLAAKHKVLLLDPARGDPDPARGVLANDFVRGLLALEPQIKADKNLVVICGAGEGQRAWDSEEWRCGAFTHSLLEGLRGRAAPEGQTLITAWDLYEFVRKDTETWARDNRTSPQTPILVPAADAGGRAVAQDILVAVKLNDAPPDDPKKAPGATFQVPEECVEHWRIRRKLERATPAPAVYSPRLWRRYRELLLRYEQMVRADAAAAVAKLHDALKQLETDLDRDRGLGLTSVGNALPLPAALGLGGTGAATEDALDQDFRDFWSARTPPAEAWKAMEEKYKALPAGVLRLRLMGDLLQRAGGDKPEAFAKAADLIAGLTTAGVPRPAEAHFAVMLRHFAKGQPDGAPRPELRRLALTVRRKAEPAALAIGDRSDHPYSERVWQVLRPAVEAADAERRSGEDLLFAADVRSHEKAGTLLGSAARKYDDALKSARQLQDALAERDRALADLPFLARWLASQPPDESRTKEFEALCQATHDLARRLDSPDPLADGRIAEAMDAVARPFKAWSDEFQRFAGQSKGLPELQNNWQQTEQALAVPLLSDPELRKDLLEQSRRMTTKFNEGAEGLRKSGAFDKVKPGERAQVRARLALAVLGDDLLNRQRSNDKSLLDASGLQPLITALSAEKWQSEMVRAGAQFGRHWKALASTGDEHFSRTALQFEPTAPPEPALRNRLTRWQGLLVWLARRTALDHWYAEDPREAYFRNAARRYLDDAKALAELPPPEFDAADALVKLPPLRVEGETKPVRWTSEERLGLTYKLVPPGGGLAGFPVVWAALDRNAPVRPEAPEAFERRPVELARPELPPVVLRPPEGEQDRDVVVALHAFFRGQTPEFRATIRLTRRPDVVVAEAEPPADAKARIAVRADSDLDLGAVAIVLDCSGSMWSDKRVKFEDSRYYKALETLEATLRTFPPGTPVSLRGFGIKKEAGEKSDPLPLETLKETRDTLDKRLFKVTADWGPDNPGSLPRLMETLRRPKLLDPLGYTPLVRTMVHALKDDLPAEPFDRPRTLLVLTDGEDNSCGQNPGPAQIAAVRKGFEDAFRDARVNVFMVLIESQPSEEAFARGQFEKSLQKLDPPGRIEKAAKREDLGAKLRDLLRVRLLLTRNGVPAPGPERGHPADDASTRLYGLTWSAPIPADDYLGQVRLAKQRISLAPADRLLIRLRRNDDGTRFERGLFAKDPYFSILPPGRVAEGRNWLLAALTDRLQQSRLAGPELQLLVTAEDQETVQPGREGELRVVKPEFVWWELEPKTPPTVRKPLRVTREYGYPAAAWRIDRAEWPDEAPGHAAGATLKAWVGSRRPSSFATLARDPQRDLADDFRQADVQLDGEKVEVSAAVERHRLRARPDEGEPPEVSCLVVRVRHPKGKPVFVRPLGLPAATTREHQFYYEAGCTTSWFGVLTPAQVRGRFALELISVADFQQAPTTTELKLDLPEPSARDNFPQKTGS